MEGPPKSNGERDILDDLTQEPETLRRPAAVQPPRTLRPARHRDPTNNLTRHNSLSARQAFLAFPQAHTVVRNHGQSGGRPWTLRSGCAD